MSYLSKRFTKQGLPIAFDTGDQTLVFYSREINGESHIKSKGQFEPFVFGDSLVYVAGKRGSGKSSFANIYIKNYVEATDGKVFIISRFETDPSIKLPDRGIHIPIEDLPSVRVEDLKDSLVVFDDLDNSQYTRNQVIHLNKFVTDVMMNSRHFNIKVLITGHQFSNYSKTRAVLNESSAIVVYPQFSNVYQIQQGLRVYFSMRPDQIRRILDVKDSRWVYINTVQPKFVMTEKEIYTYNNI